MRVEGKKKDRNAIHHFSCCNCVGKESFKNFQNKERINIRLCYQLILSLLFKN